MSIQLSTESSASTRPTCSVHRPIRPIVELKRDEVASLVSTDSPIVEHKILWTIERFSRERDLHSQRFTIPECGGVWFLEISCEGNSTWVSLRNEMIDCVNQDKWTIGFNWTLGKGFPHPSGRSKMSKILKGSQSFLMSRDGPYDIRCVIALYPKAEYSSDIISCSRSDRSHLHPIGEAHSLLNDLGEYFGFLKENEVTFIAKDGSKVMANRNILMARSEVFRAMFSHSTTAESQLNQINLEDVDASVLKAMVNFLHHDTVSDEDMAAMAEPLLLIADKYALKKLQLVCENALFKSINIGNAFKLLSIAEAINSQVFKEACIDFISNQTLNVLESEELRLKRPDIYQLLLRRLADREQGTQLQQLLDLPSPLSKAN